jgi:hypothetical protein
LLLFLDKIWGIMPHEQTFKVVGLVIVAEVKWLKVKRIVKKSVVTKV